MATATPKILNRLDHPSWKDFKQQSTAVEGTKKPGQTAHYRHAKWNDLKGELPLLTLYEMFESGLHQARDSPCLGHRPVTSTGADGKPVYGDYKWQTFAEVDKRRKAVGSALADMFNSGRLVTAGDYSTVGLWSVNRPEWQVVDTACQAYGKVSVSLYDTLGPDSVEYIINHAELSIVFASENHIQALLDVAEKCPVLKMIVSFDPIDASKKTAYIDGGKEKGVEVLELSEFESLGETKLSDPTPPSLEDVSTICYTSGTTNTPKGVILTHNNLASAALGNLHGIHWPKDVVYFSYLPLAHIYGRVAELLMLACGGRIGYFTGSPLNLLSDVQALKPHFFPSVPRVLNKIYQVAMANTRLPGIKGFLFRRAIAAKSTALRASGNTAHFLWDAIIFKKVQAVLGGRLCLITSGSAPINVDTLDFFKYSFACDVIEGYGLTESGATCARTWPGDFKAGGTIGGVSMINEVKLVDVPELNYLSEDQPNPRGELCIRGANIFGKYYKDEANTRSAIDGEGWFHTGDVAEIDSVGRLKIIDRIKNIMKLAQGEYVALEKVENLYTACPVVSQVYIHGDSLQEYLIAVIVPDAPALARIADSVGEKFDATSQEALEAACKNEKVMKAVVDSTTAQMKQLGLKGFEIAKAVYLTTTQFTVENDTLTPTFKIKRKQAYALHKEVLDGIYAKSKQ